MSKVLTKQLKNKVFRYFLKSEDHLTKPELIMSARDKFEIDRSISDYSWYYPPGETGSGRKTHKIEHQQPY